MGGVNYKAIINREAYCNGASNSLGVRTSGTGSQAGREVRSIDKTAIVDSPVIVGNQRIGVSCDPFDCVGIDTF